MGLSLRSRFKTKKTEHAVEAPWLTPSEDIEEGAISREDDGFSCLGYSENNHD
jgi:hypothetical protein